MVQVFLINVSDKKYIPFDISYENQVVNNRASSVIGLKK